MTATPPEQRAEALRRRRNARFIGFVVIVAALTAAAIFVRPSEDDNAEGSRRVDRKGRAEAACGAEAPPTAEPPRYDEPPEPALEEGVDYRAVISTSCGQIALDLLEAKAPINVNNFVFLAREGFYDGVTFHRVIPGFMAQTGDPTGTGRGDAGYKFDDEPSALRNRHDGEGVVSMANAGPNTNGSQIFITYAATPHLDGKHAVFGRVIKGMDVLRQIAPRDPQRASGPGDRIESVEISEE